MSIEELFNEEIDNIEYEEDHAKSRIVKKVEDEVNAQFGDLSPEIKDELDEIANLKAKLKELRSKMNKLKNYRVPSLLHKNAELAEKRRLIKQEIANIQLRFEEINAQRKSERQDTSGGVRHKGNKPTVVSDGWNQMSSSSNEERLLELPKAGGEMNIPLV